MPQGPIQTQPRGLLGLLNLKSLGLNPPEMLDQVYPTVDLTRLYLQGQPEIVTANFNVNGFGYTSSGIQIPNSEIWFVTEVALVSVGVLGAGASIDWAPGWQDISGPGFICGDYKSAGAGESPQTGFRCNGVGFALVPPGATFGAHTRTFAVGPIAAQMAIRFTRARQ